MIGKKRFDSATDPVCKMQVEIAGANYTLSFQGTTHYFCCQRCLNRFAQAPQQFEDRLESDDVAGSSHPRQEARNVETSPGSQSTDSEYTCPMHPLHVQIGPGPCPLCGMDLEPKEINASEEESSPELTEMTQRFFIALLLSLPTVVLSMSDMIPCQPLRSCLPPLWSQVVQLSLASPVVLWCGYPIFQRAWRSLLTGQLNMFTLIAAGTSVSFAFSLVAVLAPAVLPESFCLHGQSPVYFETAATIITLVLLGQTLELRARRQAGSAIRDLLALKPQTGRLVLDNSDEQDVPLAEIKAGNRLRVRPGEKVPADGVVLDGHSTVDESMMTGESIPIEKYCGSPVTAGTINGTGTFLMKVEKTGNDTLLGQIIQLVNQAQRSRAPVQSLADKVASIFVPSVITIAAFTFFFWAIWGPQPWLSFALTNAVSVLIIACPCALGLSTPMSIMVAVGRGAREGILIKDASALEILEKVDTIAIDKTGTLTEGKPKLAQVVAVPGVSEEDVLSLAAGLEHASEHPLAQAILQEARQRQLSLPQCQNFQSITGRGITGEINGRRVAAGSRALLADLGATSSSSAEYLFDLAEHQETAGLTILFLADGSKLLGLLAIADPLKPSTADSLMAIRQDRINVLMLTGDSQPTAQSLGRQLSFAPDQIHAQLLPIQKAEVISLLRSGGAIVAMAGDGINDAVALSTADVGIAMGNGSGVAIESAGITLIRGDLRGIVRARRLSRVTMTNIRQNLFFAFAYNAIGIILATGIFYPAFGILLNPMIAAAAMSMSSLSVVANSLRLREARL